MDPDIIAGLINGAIPFLAGVYATLLRYRIIKRKPSTDLERNLKQQEWLERYGGFMRVGGPLLIVFGVFLAFQSIFWMNWIRYSTTDGVCNAEFPKSPTKRTKSVSGVETSQLVLSLPGRDTAYILSYSEIPKSAELATNEEVLDSFRLSIPLSAAQQGQRYELVSEKKITVNSIPGRYLEFAVGKSHTSRTKVFIVGARIYRMIAVTPKSKSLDETTERFLDSIQFNRVIR